MFLLLEILGGMFFFTALFFWILILIPSIFGCMGFVIMLSALLGILVFFSINLKWFLLILLLFVAAAYSAKILRYVRLPNYASYIINHAVTNPDRLCCYNCGSAQIAHFGLFSPKGKMRYFACLRCRKWLYKFKVI
jgi:hypothetical protein